MGFRHEYGKEKAVFRLTFCRLSLGLLTVLVGCGTNPHSVEHADVSGRVTLKGTALPGGQVTFITVKGGFASNGTIDENGNYQTKAPVGDVEISVTNRMLQSGGGAKTQSHPKRAAPSEGQIPKGRWVPIPSAYEDPHTSGLRYTVKPGPQTHDIELSANPGPPPAPPGS
jgi:hypothetical protein